MWNWNGSLGISNTRGKLNSTPTKGLFLLF